MPLGRKRRVAFESARRGVPVDGTQLGADGFPFQRSYERGGHGLDDPGVQFGDGSRRNIGGGQTQ